MAFITILFYDVPYVYFDNKKDVVVKPFDLQPLPGPQSCVFHFDAFQGVIQLPQGFDWKDSTTRRPLILFFHGRGGSAVDSNFATDDFARFRQLAWQRGYIVAVPDFSVECWMNVRAEQMVLRMLTFLGEHLSIDLKRIYVMGVSMGGGGSLTFSMYHMDTIAKVCDIMGMTDYAEFAEENDGRYRDSIAEAYGGTAQQISEIYRDRSAICHIEKLKNLPLLIIHGQTDTIVPIKYSENLYAKLQAVGGKVEYIPVPNVAHENKIIINLEEKVLDYFS
jgi:dipeptidyl aminopeptidase/acylaminoacyl peptidase